MPRLFVAVDAPDAVRELLAALKKETAGVKWVPVEQLHFTLRFLGDFDDVAAIAGALRKIAAAPFSVRIAGVGQFPPKRAARVLWAGLHPVQEISSLARSVNEAVVAAGVAPDDRPFSPHLTLARIKDAPPAVAREFLAANAALSSELFPVDRFHLYQSELSSKGAKHTVLETFPLTAIADR